MKKQFSVRARLQIYLERADFDRVTELARGKGMLVAEFVREKLLAGIRENREKEVLLPESVVNEVRQVTQDNIKKQALNSNARTTCKHGKQKGYHCWQCGGLAVIE